MITEKCGFVKLLVRALKAIIGGVRIYVLEFAKTHALGSTNSVERQADVMLFSLGLGFINCYLIWEFRKLGVVYN